MKIHAFRLFGAASACLSLLLFTTGCEPNARSGALTGAAAGAVVGAITDDDDDFIKSAAIGAGIGAAAGAIVKARRYRGGGRNAPASGSYPTGSRTSNPDFVRSPYPPNNVIDVTGFRSGELVIDPTTNQVFRVP